MWSVLLICYSVVFSFISVFFFIYSTKIPYYLFLILTLILCIFLSLSIFVFCKYQSLENPTLSQLITFLKSDDTDLHPYIRNLYVCHDFATTLQQHAYNNGIRCGYVSIEFVNGERHALNAFQTTDEGLVYIDATGTEGQLSVPKLDGYAFVDIGFPFQRTPIFPYENYGFAPLPIIKSVEVTWGLSGFPFYN
jgi:hypothetical protein